MARPDEPAQTPRPNVARRPLLVVAEDDVEMRRLVADALRAMRADVLEFADGTQLVAFLARLHVSQERDVVAGIVSDIRMPGCSGLELLEGLRRAKWDVPVVLMTAFGDDETRARAAALGAQLFDKPFRIDALRAAVRRLLAPRPNPDEREPSS